MIRSLPRLVRLALPATLLLASPAIEAKAPPAASVPATAHPALWKVQRGGATIWLFGTIHALPAGYRWRNPAIDDVIAHAQQLVIEAKLDDPAAEATTFLALAKPATPPPPLADRVPRRDRKALAAMIAKSAMPAAALDGMKTWAAGFALVGVSMVGLGVSGGDGVEAALKTAFAANARPIGAFETMEQQLRFFDGLPEAEQREFLDGVVAPSDEKREFAHMLSAWSRGDEAAIAATFDKEMKASPALRDVLIARRNAAWADAIARRLGAPGTTLVAVGAGHLAGPQSVQAMLAAKGIKVERVE